MFYTTHQKLPASWYFDDSTEFNFLFYPTSADIGAISANIYAISEDIGYTLLDCFHLSNII